MSCALHPYIVTAESPFMRLVLACFWQAADPDFRHAAYWREQVEQCQGDFEASFSPSANVPADVVARRRALHVAQVAIAIAQGYALANKRRVVSVDVPGFQSGSVCNTRTLCNGLHS